ncbi:MAG: S24 family peptidase, partial [Chloroflexota bacterium]|nr:S24 family peptidase [Chloroflexota bacterium]
MVKASGGIRAKTKELSPKGQRILQFLGRFFEEKGYPPTIRDILKACEMSSTSVVDYHLHLLEREGYIRRDREVSRGIELLHASFRSSVRVPVIGTIAAGQPIPVPSADTWTQEASEVLELPREMAKGKADIYALRVKGNSMMDALIGDGDLVLLEPV